MSQSNPTTSPVIIDREALQKLHSAYVNGHAEMRARRDSLRQQLQEVENNLLAQGGAVQACERLLQQLEMSAKAPAPAPATLSPAKKK